MFSFEDYERYISILRQAGAMSYHCFGDRLRRDGSPRLFVLTGKDDCLCRTLSKSGAVFGARRQESPRHSWDCYSSPWRSTSSKSVSYTHLRAHETPEHLV